MSAEQIAEVIRAHQPTTGMSVASGVTCRCGYWNGEERAGINRPVGYQGLQWHQAQELSAAGFGVVADAKAEALEEAAKDLDWVKPESACEDAEACCGSAASCDAMRPSSYVVGPDWLRKRAADLRAVS